MTSRPEPEPRKLTAIAVSKDAAKALVAANIAEESLMAACAMETHEGVQRAFGLAHQQVSAAVDALELAGYAISHAYLLSSGGSAS